ncbi:hypothetical protein PQX77_016018 [Marasmius sp. AFHP31]|nr:hypothetical protein PQX77_016018 [Marasmius sp. AFHP31]
MSMFHSARRTKIIGGNFSIVQGSQNNNSCSHSQSGERNLVRIQPGEEWKEMLYQEYERISLGKIKLLKTLCRKSPIAPSRRRRIMANEEGCPEAERVVEIASIVDGRRESLPLLTVRYAGRDAKEDIYLEAARDTHHEIQYSDSTMPQFRAFNDSDIPIIIFNEELISASHFLSHNLNSVHAQYYLYLQIHWGALLDGSSDEHRAWVLSTSKSYRNITHLLWFRPQTGVLCFGPPGPPLEYKPSRSSFVALHRSEVEYSRPIYDFELPRNPLPLNVCTDTTFFDYIMHNVPEQFAVSTMSSATLNFEIRPIHRDICDWKERLMAEESWTTSWDSRNFSRLVPKLLPSDQWHSTCTYGPWLDEQDQCEPTGKGGMRFHIAHSINSAGFFFQRPTNNFQYYTIREGWLAQAGHIFRSLRVPREKWSSFAAIIQGFSLEISSDARELFGTEYTNCNEFLGLPCYLFLPPPPKLPNGAPDIETWLRGENLYYYSYDPEGGSAITEQERIALGLRSYTSEVQIRYVYWEADAYDFMEQWQEAKGFDYSTPDYAESLGIRIYEGIPQAELRFEDLVGTHCEEVSADDSMDVDSEFGNTTDDCESSPSGADMDVDE